MRGGAETLIEQFGSRLGVAEALILGKLTSYQQGFVPDVVSPIILQAAEARLRLGIVKIPAQEEVSVT